MATEPRYCVNCKHYRKRLIFNCLRDVKTVVSEPSLVTGEVHTGTIAGTRASDERRWAGEQYCSPEAKHYVEKRWTKRLIAVFKA